MTCEYYYYKQVHAVLPLWSYTCDVEHAMHWGHRGKFLQLSQESYTIKIGTKLIFYELWVIFCPYIVGVDHIIFGAKYVLWSLSIMCHYCHFIDFCFTVV